MRWRDIPRQAKAYMIYHTIIAPQLIVWTLLPVYLMKTGYSILDVGVFFGIVNVASVPITYLIGRVFNEVDLKKGFVVIDFLVGVAYVLYGFAKGAFAPIFLFLGRLFEKISEMMYPLYPAYEQIIYPQDKYEEIFAWHLRLPEIASLISYPIFGYFLGYVFTQPKHYRAVFLFFGLFSAFTIYYIVRFFPSVGKKERISPEGFKFRAGEFKALLVFETLITLVWSLSPEFVLINYLISELKKTVFEVTLVSVAMSLSTIAGTYISERLRKERSFEIMAFGIGIYAFYTFVMSTSPPLGIVVAVYALGSFGDAIWFPFYRAWMFRMIPRERVSEFHAALSSYRKTIQIFSPFIAGWLASLNPTLPYTASFSFSIAASALLIFLGFRARSRERV